MSKDPAFLFESKEWKTPNTYDSNFGSPSNKPGVYLLVKTDVDILKKTISHEILYVGSSKKLYERFKNHEVLRLLKQVHEYIQFYFLHTLDYIEMEKLLIKKIQPKHNTQWL